MKKTGTLLMIIFSTFSAMAQSDEQRTLEYLRQEEHRRNAETMRQLDSGVYYMDHGKYQEADEKFRYALTHLRSVPSDLTFYFGKNSFHLDKFSQSVDWLSKYIQLKGTTGQFYDEAVSILNRAEAELLKSRAKDAKQVEEVMSTSYDIDCGPSEKVSCPVCMGSHVIRKPGAFGPTYKTCPYCNEHGILTCEEYNLLLRGQLKPKS